MRTFSYDVENRLIGVTGGAAPLTIAYDPLGRIAKTTSGTTGTDFLYDGSRLIAEYNSANGALLRSYVHGMGTDDPLLWLEGGPSAYNVENTGNDPRWLYRDRQGSVIGVAGANGIITPYTYGPYGEPQSWAGSRFRYTGQIALPEAQLYHYKARAYDPVMGRFLQTDPIGYGDGMNIYAYVRGDPVNGVDPSGMARPSTVPGCNYTDCNGNSDVVVVTGGSPTTSTLVLWGGPANAGAYTAFWATQGIRDFFVWERRKLISAQRRERVCAASRALAADLSVALDRMSSDAGWIALGTGIITVASGAAEAPTVGLSTPGTVTAGSATAFASLYSVVTGGLAASLKDYAKGNNDAKTDFNFSQFSELSTQLTASKITLLKPLSDELGGIAGKVTEFSNLKDEEDKLTPDGC